MSYFLPKRRKPGVLGLAVLGALAFAPLSVHASEAELKALINQLQQRLDAQDAKLQSQAAEIKQLHEQTDQMAALQGKPASAAAAPAQMASANPVPAGVSMNSTIPANSPAASATANAAVATASPAPAMTRANSDTSFGGYGELNYNNYVHDGSRTQADLRRFVLLLNHQFSDRLSFNSEMEWEHAVTSASDQGESEIEQAFLNYQIASGVNLKAGLFLMPFGFINQSHEPPMFYGVERNEVETRIIPSTWREGGIGLWGSTKSGFAWDVGVTTGFDVAKFDDPSAPLHAIHQELQLAKAHDLSVYGALNYQGIPGWTVGGGVFTGNSTHDNADYKANADGPDLSGIKGRVTLWDVHTRWQGHGWDLQALYTRGTIGEAAKIDASIQAFNNATQSTRPYVPGAFYGWLMQAAYTVWEHGNMTLTPFVRYERYNTQAHMPEGFAADPANADHVATMGLTFSPYPQVVCKADYQKYQDNHKNDRFNLGLGYMF
ncbi:porin [Dyella soli]